MKFSFKLQMAKIFPTNNREAKKFGKFNFYNDPIEASM